MTRIVLRITLLALFTAALVGSADAQAPGWEWIDPYPVGHNLQEVVMRPDGAVLAAGGHQTMIATSDGGGSWRSVHIGDYRTIRSIEFVSSLRGWAVGSGGGVVRSFDGGVNWVPVDVGMIGAFNDVAFASDDVGVIVGGAQLAGLGLLRTSDAGETWRVVPLEVSPTLIDVEFRSGVGLAVGASGTILRTLDHGLTWAVVRRDSAADHGTLEALAFISDDVVLAAGANERILRSSDRGQTWVPVRFAEHGRIVYDLAFGDEQRGVAVGDRGEPLYTSDGGQTWSISAAALNPRTAAVFSDEMTVWSVGTVGHVSRSTDGGASWTTLSRATAVANYFDVAVDVRGRIAALDRDGQLVVSDTTQKQLATHLPDRAIELTALAWSPDGSVIAVGASGRIVRWSGGAGSPRDVPSGTSARLADVSVGPSGLGWAVGAGVVLHTTDGGASWSLASSPTTDVIDGVGTFGDSVVWIVGRRGLIYRSTDAGTTWTERRSPTTNFLSAVHAIDRERAIVVGASGVAILTEDGGITWTFASVAGNPTLIDVAFVDALNGVAVGQDAAAAYTTDGGRTWTRNDVPIREARAAFVHLLGAAAIGRRVVAAGSGGVLLGYDFEERATTAPLPGLSPQSCASARVVGGVLELELTCGDCVARRVELYDLLGQRIAAHGVGDGVTADARVSLPLPAFGGPRFVIVILDCGQFHLSRVVIVG